MNHTPEWENEHFSLQTGLQKKACSKRKITNLGKQVAHPRRNDICEMQMIISNTFVWNARTKIAGVIDKKRQLVLHSLIWPHSFDKDLKRHQRQSCRQQCFSCFVRSFHTNVFEMVICISHMSFRRGWGVSNKVHNVFEPWKMFCDVEPISNIPSFTHFVDVQ